MLQILKQYEQDGTKITEYTKDGKTVSHTVKTPILNESEPIEPKPAIEELIFIENQYQTALLEMQSMLGGEF